MRVPYISLHIYANVQAVYASRHPHSIFILRCDQHPCQAELPSLRVRSYYSAAFPRDINATTHVIVSTPGVQWHASMHAGRRRTLRPAAARPDALSPDCPAAMRARRQPSGSDIHDSMLEHQRRWQPRQNTFADARTQRPNAFSLPINRRVLPCRVPRQTRPLTFLSTCPLALTRVNAYPTRANPARAYVPETRHDRDARACGHVRREVGTNAARAPARVIPTPGPDTVGGGVGRGLS